MPPSVTTFAPSSTLTNSSSISYNLIINESVTGLSNTDFVTTGSTSTCGAIAVTGSGSSYLVTATGCGDGTLKMKLLANSITGTVGGPAADAIAADVLIDRTVPTVIVSTPATPSSLLTLEYGFLFSESITGLAASDFIVTGTSCEVSAVSGSVLRYTVQVTRCADGVNTSLTLTANSVSDVAGNLGPATVTASTTVAVDRGTLVVATPTPTATPTPSASSSASPTPSQSSAPAQGGSPAPVSTGSKGDGPASGSGSGTGGGTALLNQVSSLEIVAAQPVRRTYAFSSAIKLPTSPTEEPIAIYEPDAPQISIDNPTDDPPVAAKNDWQQYAMIGVGSLSGLLATIGITKGVRRMRTRRLVRKFA
jgi:hypothetical protein